MTKGAVTKSPNMSSRVLRKLQGEKGIGTPQLCEENECDFNFSPSKPRRRKKEVVNPFDVVSVKELMNSSILDKRAK